jgi:hypothetical protein
MGSGTSLMMDFFSAMLFRILLDEIGLSLMVINLILLLYFLGIWRFSSLKPGRLITIK